MKDALPGSWTNVVSGNIGTNYQTQVLGMTKIEGTYYAATRSLGLYESNDGMNWTRKINTNVPSDISIFSFTSNRLVSIGTTLFVATPENGIFKSTDYGDSWSRVDQGFATWNQFGTTPIMCLYSDGTNLYASMGSDDSAYVSTDLGNSWSDISDGLDHYIRSFSMHNGRLYASQWDRDTCIVVYDGIVNVERKESVFPDSFELSQNYPNPFNPSTVINFKIPISGLVTLKVYNLLGEEVATILNEYKTMGIYEVEFSDDKLTSGVYYYRLESGTYTQIKKMILLK